MSIKLKSSPILQKLEFGQKVNEVSYNARLDTTTKTVHISYRKTAGVTEISSISTSTAALVLKIGNIGSKNSSLGWIYSDNTRDAILIYPEYANSVKVFPSNPNKTVTALSLGRYEEGDVEIFYEQSGIFANVAEITTLYHRNLSDTSVWGKVDLGTLEWTKNAYCFEAPLTYAQDKAYDFGVCLKYPMSKTPGGYSEMLDKTIIGRKSGLIVYIRDDSYTNATDFKSAMSGVYLWYELSTNTKPTKLELTKLRKNTSNVWDEEWELGILSDTTGEPISGNAVRSKNFIPILPSQKYCFVKRSGVAQRAVYYDENKNFISFVDQIATNQPYTVFTTPSNAHYYKFYVLESTYNHDISINYPSSITTYSPHYVTVFNKLPSEYQEVEYLHCDGQQWIDTQFTIDKNSGAEVTCISESNNSIVGAYYLDFNITNRFSVAFSILNTSERFNYSSATGQKYKLTLNKGLFYVDDKLEHTFEVRDFQQPRTLKLLSRNSGNEDMFKGYVFYCKVYDNDILVRNYVPCYRKSDNEIGMYDLVNGVFYTNQGTGTFTVGRDID